MFVDGEEGKNYVPLTRGDCCVVRAGSIYLKNVFHIIIKKFNYYDMGGNGIFVSGYNKDHVIDNNEFINFGYTCIQVVGLPVAALRKT